MSLFTKIASFLRIFEVFCLPLHGTNHKPMAKKKILFINQEIAPYVPDNEMSLMGQALPQAIQERGHEIRTFMPKWGIINERRGQLHEVQRLSGMNLIINDTDHPLIIKVASIQTSHIQVYFIDNDEYFSKRKMTADVGGIDYSDNGERAIFFARSVLETVNKQRWAPDIIHCQGWMSAAVPLYVKTAYRDEPSFAQAKVVTSLFPTPADNKLSLNLKEGIEFRSAKPELLDSYKEKLDFKELSKLAIDYSDGIIQASNNVDSALIKYAQKKSIPVLDYLEDFADAYEAFYDQIYPDVNE
jgi:starch synthase